MVERSSLPELLCNTIFKLDLVALSISPNSLPSSLIFLLEDWNDKWSIHDHGKWTKGVELHRHNPTPVILEWEQGGIVNANKKGLRSPMKGDREIPIVKGMSSSSIRDCDTIGDGSAIHVSRDLHPNLIGSISLGGRNLFLFFRSFPFY
ncbi:hypothetical protein AMTR_s00025p00160610 [Amborella trichopoda]|uniref:Uncharacterized protein n=1 Tax=Amborella trichopoda TaxID=13333 RepID=W1PWD9_AMBTC|nr:hypothetical protein AMTR_s00025p00160610 [Amborella trichopoda]